MRIVREDQNLMIIKDRSLSAFFTGGLFFTVGLVVIFKTDFFDNHPPIWSGLFAIAIGLFLILISKVITIIFDKNIGQAILTWKSLVSKKSAEYSINSIKSVQLKQVYRNSNGNSSKASSGYVYELFFILDSGDEIILYSSGGGSMTVNGMSLSLGRIPEKHLGLRIAAFLNVPFEEMRAPTITELISTVKSAISEGVRDGMQKETENR